MERGSPRRSRTVTRHDERRTLSPLARWNASGCCVTVKPKSCAPSIGRLLRTRLATRWASCVPRSETSEQEKEDVAETRATDVDDHVVDVGAPVREVERDGQRQLSELDRKRQSEAGE